MAEPMKWHIEEPSRPILPTAVVYSSVFYGVYWIWFLWLSCTTQCKVGRDPETTTMISDRAYWQGTGLNVFFLSWLVVSL